MTDTTDSDSTAVPTDALARQALCAAREHCEYRREPDDGLEYDWPTVEDVTKVEVTTADSHPTVVVHCVVNGTRTRRTARRTRWHPAEYETVDHRVMVTVEWPLDGDLTPCTVDVVDDGER